MFIQTISGINSQADIVKISEVIRKLNLKGVRINLCKIPDDKIGNYYETILARLLSRELTGIDFYFDIPFPRNKSRIAHSNIVGGRIKKDSIYSIIFEKETEIQQDQFIIVEEGRLRPNLRKGSLIFYGDGEGSFIINSIEKSKIIVKACNNFYIKKDKAIFIANIENKLDEKWGDLFRLLSEQCPNKINVLPSFVDNKANVSDIRKIIPEIVTIFPKIETAEAVKNIESIIEVSDGIVLARGDLALNIKLSEYLHSLRRIAFLTKEKQKKVICATDILNHIGERMVPERAELIDLLAMFELGIDTFILPGTNTEDIFNSNELKSKQIFRIIQNRIEFADRLLKESITNGR
ncbi:pyruvate kinase [Enterococcus sp. DIV0724b]|uniref:pyruvate kinase n=1 Tax=Enterococcus sp. DIV0724b TaxID=2774694 RepID=UPI003D301554